MTSGIVRTASSGGGLYLAGSGTDLLVNDTIARNSAEIPVSGGLANGGGLSLQGSVGGNHAQVWNTLIAGNAADTHPDVDGAFVSLGHNLIGDTAGATGFSAARGDLLNIPASRVGLAPLA